jgi:uncharacterized OB-fold protein
MEEAIGMSDIFTGVEPMVYKSKINVPYHWWAGETASKFFIALRDEKKILGTKCPACGKTFIPPRKHCPLCFNVQTEWVELPKEGEVVSFTVVRSLRAALGKKVPAVFALVKLDGADTAIMHYLENVKIEKVRIGMRVRAVFAEERKGRMQDIAHFEPV